MQRPLVIAHRGYSGRYIENTMPAFQAAADLGADWIECDVHLSRDGEVVIHHDETLERLSGRHGKLTDYTLGELQQVKLKQADQTGQIPSLADYLGWVKDKHIVTNIEIKRHTFKADSIEKKVVYLVEESGLVEKSVISSFDHKTLHQVKKHNPDLKLAYLTRKWDKDFLDKAKELNPDYIHIRHDILSKDRVLQLKQVGYKINTWTLNQPSEIDRALNLEVDGIVTDHLEMLEKRVRFHEENS